MSDNENEIVEQIRSEIMRTMEDLDIEGVNPAHLIMASLSIAVSLSWVTAKDRSEIREMIAFAVDDMVTQSEHGMMVEN